jgi:hypothetical protein
MVTAGELWPCITLTVFALMPASRSHVVEVTRKPWITTWRIPERSMAGFQIPWRKIELSMTRPEFDGNTIPSLPGWANWLRCAASNTAKSSGIGSFLVPALVFGALTINSALSQ